MTRTVASPARGVPIKAARELSQLPTVPQLVQGGRMDAEPQGILRAKGSSVAVERLECCGDVSGGHRWIQMVPVLNNWCCFYPPLVATLTTPIRGASRERDSVKIGRRTPYGDCRRTSCLSLIGATVRV